MSLRRDALVAAAHLTAFVEETCRATDPPVVGTVGILKVTPGAMNVVPGRAEMGIDLRSTSAGAKAKVSEEVQAMARHLAETRDLRADIRVLSDSEPVELSPRLVRLLEEVCQEAGHPYRLMPSGAGHDAMQMARITEAGLLLIPSREGISHNPAEWSELEDIVRAAEVTLEAVRRLAG
jgi:N-carbamoyl-L-amino-acid hydrolase